MIESKENLKCDGCEIKEGHYYKYHNFKGGKVIIRHALDLAEGQKGYLRDKEVFLVIEVLPERHKLLGKDYKILAPSTVGYVCFGLFTQTVQRIEELDP